MAERAGFEPANLCGLHAFQACALSQTTRPLHFYYAGNYTRNFISSCPLFAVRAVTAYSNGSRQDKEFQG